MRTVPLVSAPAVSGVGKAAVSRTAVLPGDRRAAFFLAVFCGLEPAGSGIRRLSAAAGAPRRGSSSSGSGIGFKITSTPGAQWREGILEAVGSGIMAGSASHIRTVFSAQTVANNLEG